MDHRSSQLEGHVCSRVVVPRSPRVKVRNVEYVWTARARRAFCKRTRILTEPPADEVGPDTHGCAVPTPTPVTHSSTQTTSTTVYRQFGAVKRRRGAKRHVRTDRRTVQSRDDVDVKVRRRTVARSSETASGNLRKAAERREAIADAKIEKQKSESSKARKAQNKSSEQQCSCVMALLAWALFLMTCFVLTASWWSTANSGYRVVPEVAFCMPMVTPASQPQVLSLPFWWGEGILGTEWMPTIRLLLAMALSRNVRLSAPGLPKTEKLKFDTGSH